MNPMKKLMILTSAFALLVTAPSLWAAEESSHNVNVSQGLTLAGPALAMHGYDPVAFFTESRPQLGSAAHSFVHDGATFRFANGKNLKMFKKNPKRYAPQFGGFCAFGVSVGAKFDGDPNLWKIVDDKLYFNLNKDIQGNWLKDVPGNIKKADKNWRKIKDAAPASLK